MSERSDSPTRDPAPPAHGPRLLPAILATIGFYAFLLFGSLFYGIPAILVGWIPPRGNHMYRLARGWGRGLLFWSGVRVEVERPPDAPGSPQGVVPSVYMANHQSLFDVPALLAALPGQARFLAKRSLFRIPVFGWSLWVAGFIPVDRENRRRATETFQVASQRLRQGSSILIFPEETRSRDGVLLPFKPGGLLLAIKTGAPVVPVGIEGTLHVQPRGALFVRPGTVRLRFGEPIEIEGASVRHRRDLERELRQRVAALAGRPPEEAVVAQRVRRVPSRKA